LKAIEIEVTQIEFGIGRRSLESPITASQSEDDNVVVSVASRSA